MAKWLVKSEPDDFSFADLQAATETLWDGVTNPQAKKNLKAMTAGDEVFFYHTGKVKAIIGTAKVVRVSEGDESEVYLAAHKVFSQPVTLAMVKAEASLAEWELVRQARLSVMPVTASAWKWVLTQSKKEAAE